MAAAPTISCQAPKTTHDSTRDKAGSPVSRGTTQYMAAMKTLRMNP